MKFRCQKRGALVLNAAAQYGFVPGIGQGGHLSGRPRLSRGAQRREDKSAASIPSPVSGKAISARKRDASDFEPRASHLWRVVGQRRAGAAFPDAANCPHSAVPEILDRRNPVRLADHLCRRQPRSRGRWRPACLGAEPFSLIQVAERLRPPDRSLLRRGISALCLVYRAVCHRAAGGIRTGGTFESAWIFGRAGFRISVAERSVFQL